MSYTKTDIKPVNQNNRIEFLDVLRGIAIQFIFMANIVFLSGLFFVPEEFRIPETLFASDDLLDLLSFTFIDGKFYSIFSLLFGIGCFIQYDKLTKKNKSFSNFFKHRMFWLLIFGLLHLAGLWLGDILTLYAILGFVLILFVEISEKKLLWMAGLLILTPLLNWFIIHTLNFNYTHYFFKLNTDLLEYFGYPTADFSGIKIIDYHFFILNDKLPDFFKMNLSNVFIRIGFILEEGRIFKVFGIFLIGIWSGRKILDNQLLENTKFLKKIALYGILLGLPMSALRTGIEFFADKTELFSFFSTLSYALSTVPLAIGYTALLALIYNKRPKLLNWIAPAGRMAFTNYISQTIISIFLFYGLGLGLAGRFGYTTIMAIALLIFLCQVVFSTIWLKFFKYGPLEWIWRQLTYEKRLPLRK